MRLKWPWILGLMRKSSTSLACFIVISLQESGQPLNLIFNHCFYWLNFVCIYYLIFMFFSGALLYLGRMYSSRLNLGQSCILQPACDVHNMLNLGSLLYASCDQHADVISYAVMLDFSALSNMTNDTHSACQT